MHFCGCSSAGGSEDVQFVYLPSALGLVFALPPSGEKKLKVALVRIHNQNENNVLLMLYMACAWNRLVLSCLVH